MSKTMFDGHPETLAFYTQVFRALAINDTLYQNGHCKLLRDMTTLEYIDYLKKIVALEITDHTK